MAQTLPADIVREIFKDYATPFRLTMRQYRTQYPAYPQPFPWYLGHLCSPWRSVFMSMCQEFWGRYILYPSEAPECIRTRIIEQTLFFLERNHGKPFSFEILSIVPRDCVCIIEMLVAESARWVDASLVIADAQVTLLSPARNRLPLLHSLIVDKEPTSVPVTCESIFSNAPHLKHLTLSFVSTWQFGWSSLTSLQLTRRNDGLLSILPQMTELEELSIPRSIWDPFPFPDKDAMPILLPHLKSLRVSELGFLSVLNTPSLKHLRIDLERYSTQWTSSPSSIPSFFTTSSCQLEDLVLRDCVPTALSVILPYTPQLKSLEIGRSTFAGPGDYFSFLTCSQGAPILASQLETLKVILGSPMGVASKPLLALIKSRTIERPVPSIQHLRQLVFILSGNLNRQDLPTMEAVHQLCETCGVDLRFEKLVDAPSDDDDLDPSANQWNALWRL